MTVSITEAAARKKPRSQRPAGRRCPTAGPRRLWHRRGGPAPSEKPLAFVCGLTPLVESVAAALVDLGHDPNRVKTGRFGPSGG